MRLESPNVRANAIGQEIENIFGQFNAHDLLFFAEDRQARFRVGRLHIGHQTPSSANQPLLEILDFAGGRSSQNDLLAIHEEC